MDRFAAHNCDRCGDSVIMNPRRSSMEAAVSMDRSAQNCDRSSDSEIMNLRRMKFVFDVAPLEIIDEDDEDFLHGGGGGVGMETNQINLVIHAVNHNVIFQYWSLKSEQQQQLNSSCHGNKHHRDHHRDHHHLRDDQEMIMIACQPLTFPKTEDIVLNGGGGGGGGVFASSADDDYIMSQLRDLDILYEIQWSFRPEQLEAVKRCIIQRINESKPAVLLAKPKTVRIRLDLSIIMNRYYANPAAAASAYAQKTLYELEADSESPTFDDDDDDDHHP